MSFGQKVAHQPRAIRLLAVCSLFFIAAIVVWAIPSTSLAAGPALWYAAAEYQPPASFRVLSTNRTFVHIQPNVLYTRDEFAPRLSLPVFGKDLEAVRTDAQMISKLNAYVWTGKIEGAEMGDVVLSLRENFLYGWIHVGGRLYKVEPVKGAEIHVLYERQGEEFAPFVDDTLIPPMAMGPPLAPQAISPDDGGVIDVLIYYTSGLAASYADVQTFILGLAALANQSYINSRVNTRLNVVHMEEVNYPDGGSLSPILTTITNGTGAFTGQPALRNQYRADLVTLLRKFTYPGNDACGIAWVMQTVSLGFADYAFSVVQVGSSGTAYCGDLTMTHELGHNMGCAHDRVSAGSTTGAYPYSYGYVRSGQWRTVMAYGTEQRISYFSNPTVSYNGNPTGIDDNAPNSADNAHTINNTSPTVAQFRLSFTRDIYETDDTPGQAKTIVPGVR